MKKVDPKNIDSSTNPLYIIFWKKYKNIKRRCSNKSRPDYKYYGGSGICVEWESFEDFKTDMFVSFVEHTKKFGKGRMTTLERINNKGNYCKNNCRWATMDEQAKNRRSGVLINYMGREKLMIDWCKELSLEYPRVKYRIKMGYSPEKAFNPKRIK